MSGVKRLKSSVLYPNALKFVITVKTEKKTSNLTHLRMRLPPRLGLTLPAPEMKSIFKKLFTMSF
jgi:hypothetical protein